MIAAGPPTVAGTLDAPAPLAAHEHQAAAQRIASREHYLTERARPRGGLSMERFAGNPGISALGRVEKPQIGAMAHAPDPAPTQALHRTKPRYPKARIGDEDRADPLGQQDLESLQARFLDPR